MAVAPRPRTDRGFVITPTMSVSAPGHNPEARSYGRGGSGLTVGAEGLRGRIAGLVLAAGISHRFGAENKLLADVAGTPLVRRTVAAYLDAQLAPVLVVVGHEASRVREALIGLPLTLLDNPEYREGQSRALVRGVRALGDVDAAVIGVADQPFLTARTLEALVARWIETRAPAVYPRYAERRGSPTLFSRALFPELLKVEGDQGGRAVLQRYMDRAASVEVADAREAFDVDTPEDYGLAGS